MSVPLAFLGIVIVWSTTPLAIKWSGENVGFLFGISGRVAIATLICLLVFIVMRWPLPRDRRALHVYLAIGLPFYIAFMSVYWGAQYISSGMVSVLFGLTPIFTGILASVWLKEMSFNVPRVAGMSLGVIGLLVIFNKAFIFGENALLAMFSILFAAFIHSLSTVWVKRTNKTLTPIAVNTGGLIVALVLFSLTWLISGQSFPAEIPDHTAFAILYLAIFGSVFGAVMFYYALKHVEATTMGMLPLITPVTALLLGNGLIMK